MDAIKQAFSKVKEDMLTLRSEIEELKNTTTQIMLMLDGKKVSESSDEQFIATKNGSKYHTPKCNFVQNISEKNRLVFNSEDEAKKAGLKSCTCVK